jgi:hypothetical protein
MCNDRIIKSRVVNALPMIARYDAELDFVEVSDDSGEVLVELVANRRFNDYGFPHSWTVNSALGREGNVSREGNDYVYYHGPLRTRTVVGCFYTVDGFDDAIFGVASVFDTKHKGWLVRAI